MKTANAQISDGLYLLSVEMIWYYEIWTCVMQVWVIAVSRAHTQNFGWVKIEFLMWLSQIECRCERNATNTQSIYRMHPSGFRCVCVYLMTALSLTVVVNDNTLTQCAHVDDAVDVQKARARARSRLRSLCSHKIRRIRIAEQQQQQQQQHSLSWCLQEMVLRISNLFSLSLIFLILFTLALVCRDLVHLETDFSIFS